ncbi:hypothetical protein [Sulfurimonas sp.]|uniref:hypothetical protein n=1 Tax=Sulfurimonas sp. TaxID=2022749 RepID=UPI003D1278B2
MSDNVKSDVFFFSTLMLIAMVIWVVNIVFFFGDSIKIYPLFIFSASLYAVAYYKLSSIWNDMGYYLVALLAITFPLFICGAPLAVAVSEIASKNRYSSKEEEIRFFDFFFIALGVMFLFTLIMGGIMMLDGMRH